jgi:hypothetical protein
MLVTATPSLPPARTGQADQPRVLEINPVTLEKI